MKRFTWMVVAVFCIAAAAAAFAQQDTGGPGPMMQQGEKREITPEQFSDLKSRTLKMIEERKTRLDQEKVCVEAATNIEEFRKCRPERPMMGPGGGFRGGMQEGQRPMRQGN